MYCCGLYSNIECECFCYSFYQYFYFVFAFSVEDYVLCGLRCFLSSELLHIYRQYFMYNKRLYSVASFDYHTMLFSSSPYIMHFRLLFFFFHKSIDQGSKFSTSPKLINIPSSNLKSSDAIYRAKMMYKNGNNRKKTIFLINFITFKIIVCES